MKIGNSVITPGSAIEVAVVIAGHSQPIYKDHRSGNLYVAGAPGREYSLNVRNLAAGRVEVITSVDGRNTLKDEPGDANRNTGLVIYSGQEYPFAGWRLNNNEVRKFVFGTRQDSVAAQATGSTDNTGIIGFAVWREKIPLYSPPAWQPHYHYGYGAGGNEVTVRGGSSMAMAAGTMASVSGAATDEGLGTGMGEKMEDRIGQTTFTRNNTGITADVLTIRYETIEKLRTMGIMFTEPQAFPGMDDTGYGKY